MKLELLSIWVFNIIMFAGLRTINLENVSYGWVGVLGQFIIILAHHSYYSSQKRVRDVDISFYLVTPVLAFLLGMFVAPVVARHFTFIKLDIWALIVGGLAEYTSEFLKVAVKTIKSIIPFLLNKATGKKDDE